MIVVGELRAWKDLQQRCGHPEPIVCSEETAYLQLWIQQVSQQQDPALMAVHGGMLADRMAWVFVAGYQGLAPYLPRSGASKMGCPCGVRRSTQ